MLPVEVFCATEPKPWHPKIKASPMCGAFFVENSCYLAPMNVTTRLTKLSELTPLSNNPRQWTKADIDRTAASLKEFPEMTTIRAIVCDENGTILGGNLRYNAALSLGWTEIEVTHVHGLTQEQKNEFTIKDNGSFGAWDFDALANEWDNYPLSDWGVPIPADWLEAEPEEPEEEQGPAFKAPTQHTCPSCGHQWSA